MWVRESRPQKSRICFHKNAGPSYVSLMIVLEIDALVSDLAFDASFVLVLLRLWS